MYFNGKSFIRNTALAFCGIFLFIYLFYHLAYNTAADFTVSDALLYLHSYLDKIWLALYPSLSASVILFVYAFMGMRAMLLGALPLSLANLAHSLPYFYIQCINYGYNSLEALGLSILISLFISAFSYACIVLLALLGLRVFRKSANSSGKALDDTVADELCCPYYFNTLYPSVKAGFFISLASALIPLAYEIYYTILAIVDFGSSLDGSEIFLMAFNYVFIILGILLTHVIFIALKNRIVKSRIFAEEN